MENYPTSILMVKVTGVASWLKLEINGSYIIISIIYSNIKLFIVLGSNIPTKQLYSCP